MKFCTYCSQVATSKDSFGNTTCKFHSKDHVFSVKQKRKFKPVKNYGGVPDTLKFNGKLFHKKSWTKTKSDMHIKKHFYKSRGYLVRTFKSKNIHGKTIYWIYTRRN
jgi:hypothetical protein